MTPRRFTFPFIAFLFSITILSAQIERPIGINLAGIEDWSSEYVFMDVFKQSRNWIAHEMTPGAPWSSGVNIPLNAQGYPLEIPYNDGVNPPQGIRTLLYFGDLNGRYPAGSYRLIASGTGQIRLWGAASGTFTCPVDVMVDVDPDLGGIALEIEESIASDPVHDIRMIMPGFEDSYETEPFNPELLDFVKDFQVIRFMDWMKTNGSPVASWEDRGSIDHFTQTLEEGIAYEYIVELCNLQQIDPWICIPHQADDEFISTFAQFMNEELDENLKVYIEYSNEVWNSQFPQTQYAEAMGAALGYTGNPWEQGWKYYAKRSADIHHIFESEFQNPDRLVKVVAAQAANSWLTNYILERYEDPFYNSNQVEADVIAIAPYFGGGVANVIGDAGLMDDITVEAILDSMELSLATSFNWMDENKAVADDHGLILMAYEGGQHLVAGPLYHNNDEYVAKLTDANRHERMQDLYCQYFNYWYEETEGGLFANFSSHGLYSKWGSWGVKEYMDDTLSPKYLGMQECVFSYNSDPVNTSIAPSELQQQEFTVAPNPATNGWIELKHSIENAEPLVYDVQGRAIPFTIRSKTTGSLILDLGSYEGIAVVVLQNGALIRSQKVLFGR